MQNFWYILHSTWKYQIATKLQKKYGKHIDNGNNNDFSNLIIISLDEQRIFFTTVCLVFSIGITINLINNSTYTSTTINPHQSTTIKIINQRKTVTSGDLFEPYIKEESLLHPQKVFYFNNNDELLALFSHH